MAETSRRRHGELLRGLFEILREKQPLQAKDALALLRTKVPPTEYEQGRFPSGAGRFEKIVRFATVDVVKAGWMTKYKGQWMVTEAGTTALKQFPDPETFYREGVRLYQQWRTANPPETPAEAIEEPDGTEDVSEKETRITFEEAEEQAWEEMEQYLRGMNPYEFQELVASLLRAMGYFVAWVSPPGRDGGIDILALSDPLGTKGPRIKVQVKRVGENVRVDGLRSFMALLGDDDVGLFVTTAGFTKDAQDEARTQEKRKVTLVDLERLFDMWVEHYERLDETAKRRLPLKPIYFLAPR